MSGAGGNGSGVEKPRRTPWCKVLLEPQTLDVLETVSGNANQVFLILRRHRNSGRKEAYPSISLMCRRLELSRATVLRALDELEDAGLIARQVAKGCPTVYTFPTDGGSITHETTQGDGGITGETTTGIKKAPNQSHSDPQTSITREPLTTVVTGKNGGGDARPLSDLEDALRVARIQFIRAKNDAQLQDFLAGWLKAKGKDYTLQVLSLPESVSQDVWDLQNRFFTNDAKASKPSPQRRAADKECPRCEGSGLRLIPSTGATTPCSCTDPARAVRA